MLVACNNLGHCCGVFRPFDASLVMGAPCRASKNPASASDVYFAPPPPRGRFFPPVRTCRLGILRPNPAPAKSMPPSGRSQILNELAQSCGFPPMPRGGPNWRTDPRGPLRHPFERRPAPRRTITRNQLQQATDRVEGRAPREGEQETAKRLFPPNWFTCRVCSACAANVAGKSSADEKELMKIFS